MFKCEIKFWAIWIIALNSTLVFAGSEGSGVRGGGEAVLFNRVPRLKDLVDRTVCQHVSFSNFSSQQSEYEPMLRSLSETHWYLALTLRNEASRLRLCLTKNIRPFTVFQRGLISVSEYSRTQVAVRLGHRVYLDETIFRQMPAVDRAALLIHEVAHSLIPMSFDPFGSSDRQDRLSSFVKGVVLNHHSRMSKEDFSLYLTQNRVQIIPATYSIDSNRRNIEVLLDRIFDLKTRLAALHQIGMALVRSSLWVDDVNEVIDLWNPAYQKGLAAIREGKPRLIQQLLHEGLHPAFEYLPGQSLLSVAIKSGNLQVMDLLNDWVEQHSDQVFSTEAATMLLQRAVMGELDTVNVISLLKRGANPNRHFEVRRKYDSAPSWMTVWSAAIVFEEWEIARILLPFVDSETLEEGFLYLMSARQNEAKQLTSEVIQSGRLELNGNAGGNPLLVLAFEAGNTPAFRELLDAGASPNVSDQQGKLILARIASTPGKLNFLTLLLLHPDLHINGVGKDKKTAFEAAIQSGNAEAANSIASNARFKIGDLNFTQAQALESLKVFVHLNLSSAVNLMVSRYRFTFFEIGPLADFARAREFLEVEAILRKNMQTQRGVQ
jgi:hypothetical protein